MLGVSSSLEDHSPGFGTVEQKEAHLLGYTLTNLDYDFHHTELHKLGERWYYGKEPVVVVDQVSVTFLHLYVYLDNFQRL